MGEDTSFYSGGLFIVVFWRILVVHKVVCGTVSIFWHYLNGKDSSFSPSTGAIKGKSRKRRNDPVPRQESKTLSSQPNYSSRGGGGGERVRDQGASEGGGGEGEGGGGGGGGGGEGGGGEGGEGGGGGEQQLGTAGAYYDKLYFETSSSEDDDDDEQGSEGRNKVKLCMYCE